MRQYWTNNNDQGYGWYAPTSFIYGVYLTISRQWLTNYIKVAEHCSKFIAGPKEDSKNHDEISGL